MYRRVLIALTALFGLSMVVGASAQALAVSPVLFDYDIAAGTNKQGVITITNDTESEDTFSLQAMNFIPTGEDGAQEYLEEEVPTGLASWIAFDRPTVTLTPGQSAEFPFVVNVPTDAEPGGHYASIFFSRGADPTRSTGVGVGGKVGVLILVNVPGDIREDARIESFTLRGSAVRDRLPAYFDLRIRNLGSVHFRPRGTLVIRNLFGSVVQRMPANPKNAAVLPNSVRRVESVWARTLDEDTTPGFWSGVRNEWKNFAIGRYEASVDVTYGSKAGQLESSRVVFWVIPWRLLLLALLALIGFILLVKGYNRILIASAMKKTRSQK